MFERCPFHASAGRHLVVKEDVNAGNWLPIREYWHPAQASRIASFLNGRASDGLKFHVIDDQSAFEGAAAAT